MVITPWAMPCGSGSSEAERASREVLALPVYPELTREAVATVVEAVSGFCRARA